MSRVPDYPSTESAHWSAVDLFFADLLTPADECLAAALANNAAHDLPPHDVSPTQGKMLELFARMTGARRILEIGTLGAYSTLWMARGIAAGGAIVTIEADERHAAVARQNITRAGMEGSIQLHVGNALDILPTLFGPFDMIFIDADKPNNPAYLRCALSLSRPGTVIVADNIVRGGAVVDPASGDPRVDGVRTFLQAVADDPRLEATAIQTVGEKGWDGFALIIVRE